VNLGKALAPETSAQPRNCWRSTNESCVDRLGRKFTRVSVRGKKVLCRKRTLPATQGHTGCVERRHGCHLPTHVLNLNPADLRRTSCESISSRQHRVHVSLRVVVAQGRDVASLGLSLDLKIPEVQHCAHRRIGSHSRKSPVGD
jgi:hypothetical protein